MKTVSILLALTSLSCCGSIWRIADPILTNQNVDSTTVDLTLFFKLENDLVAGNVFRVAFPFDVNAVFSTPIFEASSRCILANEDIRVALFDGSWSPDSSSSNIYWSVLADKLPSGSTFKITLSIQPGFRPSPGDISGPISLQTVTSIETNFMIVDENPSIARIAWTDSSSDTLILAVASIYSNLPGDNYIVDFWVTPTLNITGGALIGIGHDFETSTGTYTWADGATCIVTAVGDVSMDLSGYSCSVSPAGYNGQVIVITTNDLVANTKIVIHVYSVVNPMILSTQGDVYAYTRKRYGGYDLETGKAVGVFNTTWTTNQTFNSTLFVGFNMTSDSSAFSQIASLYQSIEQTVIINFIPPSLAITSGFKSRLQITYGDATYVEIVGTSAVSNLPPATGSVGDVRFTFSDTSFEGLGTQRTVTINKLAMLTAGETYQVAIRWKLLSNYSDSNVPKGLGYLTYSLVDDNGNAYAIISSNAPSNTLPLVKQLTSYWSASNSLYVPKDEQVLELFASLPNGAATVTKYQMDVLTGRSITFSSNATNSTYLANYGFQLNATGATLQPFAGASLSSNTSTQRYNRLKIWADNDITGSGLFKIPGVNVSSSNNFRAGEIRTDIYVIISPTGASYGPTTYNDSATSYLYGGLVNLAVISISSNPTLFAIAGIFWTSAVDIANFPSLIRSGVSNLAGGRILAIFAREITAFYLNDDDTTIQCYGTVAGSTAPTSAPTCKFFLSNNPLTNNRIEIIWPEVMTSSSSTYQIIIPIEGKSDYTSIFDANNGNDFTIIAMTSNTDARVGGSLTTTNFTFDRGGAIVNDYKKNLIGAAGLICTDNYGFTAPGVTITSTSVNTTAFAADACITFSLTSDDAPISCLYCPISSTDSTYTLTVQNFPVTDASVYGVMRGCVTNFYGSMVYCDFGDVLGDGKGRSYYKINPGAISSVSVTSGSKVKGDDTILFAFTLTTTNSVPENGWILLNFNTSISSVTRDPGNCTWTSHSTKGTCLFLINETVSMRYGGLISLSGSNILAFQLDSAARGAITIKIEGIRWGMDTFGLTQIWTFTSDGKLIDMLDSISGVEVNAVTSFTTPTPVLSNPLFYISSIGVRSIFTVNFQTANGRDLFYNDVVAIHWWDDLDPTIFDLNDMRCEVYDNNTGKFLTQFKVCSVDTIARNGIKLTAGSTINGSTSIVVIIRDFYSVKIEPDLSMYAEVYTGSGAVKQYNTSSISSIVPNYSNKLDGFVDTPTLVVRYSAAGQSADYEITFQPTNLTLNKSARIIIGFPQYYAPTISTNILTCHVYAIETFCYVYYTRTLLVYIPAEISNGSNITLCVSGVTVPVYTAAGTFAIVVDINSDDSDSVDQYDEFRDFDAPDLNVSSLIEFTSISSTWSSIRTIGTVNFSLKFSNSYSFNGEVVVYIHVEFPRKYWAQLRASSSFACSLSFIAQETIVTAASYDRAIGPRYVLNLTSNISAGQEGNLSCSGFRSPEVPVTCWESLPEISVVDINRNAVIARTNPGASPVDYELSLFSTLEIVSWKGLPADGYLEVPVGLVSRRVTLAPSEPWKRVVSFPFNSSGISATKELVTSPQDESISLTLTATKDAALGIRYIEFSKIESATNLYSNAPILPIIVTNTKSYFTLPSGTVNVPAGGYSHPVMFSVGAAPNADVRLTPSFDDDLIGFDMYPETIAFSQNITTAYVMFGVFDTSAPNDSYNVSFTVDGTNADSYTAPIGSVSLVTIEAITETPTITAYLHSASSTPIAQGITFTISSTEPVIVYWHNSRQSANLGGRNYNYVVEALGGASFYYNESDSKQEQMGFFSITKMSGSSISKTVQITNLHAFTNYVFNAWVENGALMQSSIESPLSYRTESNGGEILKMAVFFNASTYKEKDRANLLCYITNNLSLPTHQIKGINNDHCGYSGDINISYDYTSNFTDDSNVTVKIFPLFLYPNRKVEKDELNDLITNYLKITNLPAIIRSTNSSNYSAPSLNCFNTSKITVVSTEQNSFLTIPSFTASSREIILTGVVLTYPGYVFGIVSNYSISPKGLDFKDEAAAGEQRFVAYYDGERLTPSYISIIGLSNRSTYTAWLAATNDVPDEDAVWSSAISFKIALKKPKPTTDAIALAASILPIFAAIIAHFGFG